MGDIQQILQTSWPILLMVVNFLLFYCGVHKRNNKKSVLAC